jgi:protein-L-isoaspartate O-methyltransferase
MGNLAQTPHVRVVHGDGTRATFDPADVIYVNAGATRPADVWLDRLKEGGRLILPLTADRFPNRDVRRRLAVVEVAPRKDADDRASTPCMSAPGSAAILHRLVGGRGRVTAIEFDAGLAARLAANFA